MKKILMSVLVIAVAVSIAAVGISGAWFSDIASTDDLSAESPNTVTASKVDVEIKAGGEIKIGPLCPSEWATGDITIKNVGDCNGKVWLHITNVFGLENGVEDPESDRYWELSQNNPEVLRFDNDLERYITFDLKRGDDWVIPKWHDAKMADLECQWIPVGNLDKNEKVTLTLSFHIQSDADNRYQTDKVQFDVELLLQQSAADPPEPEYKGPGTCDMRVLHLENKTNWWGAGQAGEKVPDDAWAPNLSDSTYGTLRYDCKGKKFDYTFEAYGLTGGQSYSLIYYADPWAGDHPGRLIAKFTADGSGDIALTSGSVELNTDLPNPSDWNAGQGAKIWLIPSSYYDQDTPGGAGGLNAWPSGEPQDWLFEMRLINYNDTQV